MPIILRRPKSVTLLRAGVCIAALAAASPALAASECGADGVGADTITCTGASFPNGITYAGSDGLNLTLNDPTMAVLKGTATDGVNLGGTTANDLTVTATSLASVNGGTGTAVTVSNGGDGKATLVLNAGTLTAAAARTVFVTHGSGAGDAVITMAGGLVANNYFTTSYTLDAENTGSATGNATILVTGGTIQTNGNTGSFGMRALISNAASSGNATVTMTGGAMTGAGTGAQASTNGSGLAQVTINGVSINSTGSTGAQATNTGSGNAVISATNSTIASGNVFVASGLNATANSGSATVTATNSTITAKGSGGAGIQANSSSGPATVTMTGGSVSNSAGSGTGLKAVAGGTANASATLDGGTVKTTGTAAAHGVSAQAAGGQASVRMTGGTVTTNSVTADGLRAQSSNGLAVIEMTGGTVTTNGNVAAVLGTNNNSGTGTYNISITGGTVNGGTLAAVQGYSTAPGGVITIGPDAVINAKGGVTGTALLIGGLNAAAGTITTAGTITGQIAFEPGTANTLNITGGSIAGDIVGGGTDTVNFDLGSGSFTYDAAYAITGVTDVAMKSGTATLGTNLTANTVTVTGGTLVLTGAINTPAFALNGGTLSISDDTNLGTDTGALNFNGGILQVTGSTVTGPTRPFTWGANGGGFDIVDAGNVFTVGQALTGGQLTKLGAGTLVLTADNTYSGGTTISAGTLQIGNGGLAGSITGDIVDNGSLMFNRSDAVTFAGVISGSGAVNQIGTGTTNLTGVNTYTGGTTIATGTLTGSAASFGGGAITDNAALVIDQSADAVFANAINGTGSFTKQGAGRLNYTGTGSLSGATTVTAGTLAVNGSLAASAVTVQNGAALGGNGTVGATSIQSGGVLAPGNSIGTLHIAGAYRQAAGAIYQVQVDPNSNASDLIAVSGAATLDNGAALAVAKDQPGAYRLGAKYTVLHADGGVNGTYALSGDTAAASPYLGLRDSYDANNVYLSVVQTVDPATAAQTGNQAQTASGVDSLSATGDVPTAVLNTPDPVTTRSAFDQLSGEALASANSMMVAGSVLVRDTTFDRLRDVFCATPDDNRHTGCVAFADRPTVWAQGFGGWNSIYGNGNAAGISQTSSGFLVGADAPVQDWRVGVFGGYSRSDFTGSDRNAQGRGNSYHLGAYGGTAWGDLGLRLGASYSWNGLATERLVAFDDFSNDLRATYTAGTTQFFTELGQKIALDGLLVEPFANLAYVNLHTGGFRETGGPAALTSRASSLEDTFATLGVRPSTEIALGDTAIVARGMLGWRHTFGDMRPASVVSFDGGGAFTVAGVPIARDAGVIEAGFNLGLSDTAALGLTYGGQFSNRETDHSIRGTLAITF